VKLSQAVYKNVFINSRDGRTDGLPDNISPPARNAGRGIKTAKTQITRFRDWRICVKNVLQFKDRKLSVSGTSPRLRNLHARSSRSPARSWLSRVTRGVTKNNIAIVLAIYQSQTHEKKEQGRQEREGQQMSNYSVLCVWHAFIYHWHCMLHVARFSNWWPRRLLTYYTAITNSNA